MKRKNVAIIIQKLYGGGAERTASNLSVFLNDKYNVHLIVFDGRNIRYPYEGELHDLQLHPVHGKFGQVLNVFKRVKAIKKIKKENNIETSISLMDGANIVNILSKIDDKIITSVRIQMSQSRFKSSIGKFINKVKMKFIGEKSDYVVALSEGVNKDLVSNFGIPQEKVITIYNPCDGELLKEKAMIHKAEALSMADLSVTTMGRFTNQKGQWHLIRAFSEVVKKFPDAKLYLLGDGPLRETLEKLVVDLQLESNIVFLGLVEAPHAYIMESKVFVFPSLFEGLGNVLLEAIACGTPCISADCFSGPREILAPGTSVKEHLENIEICDFGILTSVGEHVGYEANEPITHDEIQLAESIKLILGDKEFQKRLSEKSLNRSMDFLPRIIISQWDALI